MIATSPAVLQPGRLVAMVQVGPYPINIYEHSKPITADDVDGYYDDERPRGVHYHQRLEGFERWAVILHELAHAALQITGVSYQLASKTEELVCDALGLALAEALRTYLRPPPTAKTLTVEPADAQ
jgi:hypothetical protein